MDTSSVEERCSRCWPYDAIESRDVGRIAAACAGMGMLASEAVDWIGEFDEALGLVIENARQNAEMAAKRKRLLAVRPELICVEKEVLGRKIADLNIGLLADSSDTRIARTRALAAAGLVNQVDLVDDKWDEVSLQQIEGIGSLSARTLMCVALRAREGLGKIEGLKEEIAELEKEPDASVG